MAAYYFPDFAVGKREVGERRGRGGGLTTKNVCHRIHHLVANHQTSEDLAVLENVYISEFGVLAVNRMHNFSINEYAIGKGEKGV